jgi:replicative DNA helicase
VTFVGDAIADTLAELEGPVTTVGTPWSDVDRLLGGGLRNGALYAVGARPGVGKSVIGLEMAAHAANSGTGALLASMEMKRGEVHRRLLADRADVDLGRLNNHTLDDGDWLRIAKAVQGLTGPLVIDDRESQRVVDIRGRARDVRRRVGLRLVVVDYLQLIQVPRGGNRQEAVDQVTRDLKRLALELGVPVVALAQLNRKSLDRADKRPDMGDLRESGAIEAHADGVLLLHHDPEDPFTLEVILAKNRHGPTGSVSLMWEPRFARVSQVYRPGLSRGA